MAEHQHILEIFNERDNHDNRDTDADKEEDGCGTCSIDQDHDIERADAVLMICLGRDACGIEDIEKRKIILSKKEGKTARVIDINRHILVAILVIISLAVSTNEKPRMPLRFWIIGYALGSVFHCIAVIKSYQLGSRWEKHIKIGEYSYGRDLEFMECRTYSLWFCIGVGLLRKEVDYQDYWSSLGDSAPAYLSGLTITLCLFEVILFLYLFAFAIVVLLTIGIHLVAICTCVFIVMICLEVFKAILYMISFNHIGLTYDFTGLLDPVDHKRSTKSICTPEMLESASLSKKTGLKGQTV